MSRYFRVGDRVQFRSEWPFRTVYGIVQHVAERPREFGPGTETVVDVAWEDGVSSTVQTWNQRLTHRTVQS